MPHSPCGHLLVALLAHWSRVLVDWKEMLVVKRSRYLELNVRNQSIKTQTAKRTGQPFPVSPRDAKTRLHLSLPGSASDSSDVPYDSFDQSGSGS